MAGVRHDPFVAGAGHAGLARVPRGDRCSPAGTVIPASLPRLSRISCIASGFRWRGSMLPQEADCPEHRAERAGGDQLADPGGGQRGGAPP
jgi:hypothetical protein